MNELSEWLTELKAALEHHYMLQEILLSFPLTAFNLCEFDDK